MQTVSEPCCTVPVSSISLSALNPRRLFDPKAIAELAATIKVHGILQPLVVRPAKAAGQRVRGMYELVAGARRLKAAQAAELTEVPVVVIDMDDEQAAQSMLVENDSRVDLSPLERADGYRQLRDGFGMSIEDIAAKVGRSTQTVKRALQFLNLSPESRKAFEEGKVNAAVAYELALVPGQLQPKALKIALTEGYEGELPSATALADDLASQFFRELKEARFDTKNAKLVPDAGACGGCPHNSATQPELFSDADAKSPARCTNLPCWSSKENAWLKQQTAAGARMLTAAEAKKVFAYGNDQVDKYRGDFIEADADEYDPSTGKSTSVRKLLGKEAANAIVYARAPSGSLVELVPKEAIPKPEVKSGKKTAKASKKSPEELKRERQLELDRRVVRRVVSLLAEHKITAAGEDVWAKSQARNFVRHIQQEAKKQLVKLLNLEAEKVSDLNAVLVDHAYSLEGKELRGFLVLLSHADRLVLNAYDTARMEPLKLDCKAFGLDYADYTAAVAKEMKEEEREKATTKKEKKAAKKGAAA